MALIFRILSLIVSVRSETAADILLIDEAIRPNSRIFILFSSIRESVWPLSIRQQALRMFSSEGLMPRVIRKVMTMTADVARIDIVIKTKSSFFLKGRNIFSLTAMP